MTFEEWVASKNFWKPDTGESFRAIWSLFDEKGHPSNEIASMLDKVVSSMRSEYGE